MLILGRKIGDTILIGDNIRIVILASDRGGARVGIDAPADVTILRGELVADVEAANQDASQTTPAAGAAAAARALMPRPGASTRVVRRPRPGAPVPAPTASGAALPTDRG